MKKLNVFSRQILSVLLAVSMLLPTLTIAAGAADAEVSPIYRIRGSGVGYYEEVTSTTLTSPNAFISWHPDFSDYKKNVSSYFFFNTSVSMSVSIAVNTMVSFTYNPAGNGSGYAVQADSTRASRPAIYADIYTVNYNAGMYNFNSKTWVSKSHKTRPQVKDTYVKILYR